MLPFSFFKLLNSPNKFSFVILGQDLGQIKNGSFYIKVATIRST